jgi:hypothetical protein
MIVEKDNPNPEPSKSPTASQDSASRDRKSSKIGVVRALRANQNEKKAGKEKPNPTAQPAQPTSVTLSDALKTKLPAIYERRAPRIEPQESPVQAAYAKSLHSAAKGARTPPKNCSPDAGLALGSLSDVELENVLRQQIQDQKKVPKFTRKTESVREPRIAEVNCITDTSAAVHLDKSPHEVVRLFYSTTQGSSFSFLVETSAMCVAITNLMPSTTVSLVVVGSSAHAGSKKRAMVHFHTHCAEALPTKLVEVSKAREYNDALQKYFAASNAGKIAKTKNPYA